MNISFVLPAYNEERLIGRAISSIHAAMTARDIDYEIVVADDASDDQTAAIARALGAAVVTQFHRQIAATRNEGSRKATGDLLVFVDADSCVNNELVGQTLAAIERGAVGGGSHCDFDGMVPLWARLVKRALFPLYAAAGLTPGAYIFATRDAFDAVGGFDEKVFGGEEVLLARALRRQGRFVVVKAAVTTSGRKLRAHSAVELLGTLVLLGVRGRRGVASRKGLALWYGPRRVDLGCPVASSDISQGEAIRDG